MIISVAVPVPLFRCFDYLSNSENSNTSITPGMRVLVPFGPRKLVGIVTQLSETSASPTSKLKTITTILDQSPSFDPKLMALLNWASIYYCHPIGDCFSTALPGALRTYKSGHNTPATIELIKWFRNNTPFSGRKNASKQIEILNYLEANPQGVWLETLKAMNFTHSQLKNLEQAGYLYQERFNPLDASIDQNKTPTATPKILNDEQQSAIKAISSCDTGINATLLQGVTGSGKTEVYIECAKHQLALGKQTLILIPEINLSPQTLQRFQSHLDTPIGVIHSGMSHKEKYTSWHLAKEGIARVIIGTRSAIFTPFKELGMIIVDEEHDSSYKQMDNFKYSARDLAVKRGQLENSQVVLGSATPSLESLYNCKTQRYQHILMKQRAGHGKPPEMFLIDIRSRPLENGCSRPLKQRIKEELQQGNQVIIFQNRRGFSPTLMCNSCGWLAQCPHCDARLTVHSHPPHLHCHHCNYKQAIPHHCEECQYQSLVPLGAGTERLEYGLKEQFPEAKIIRVDRDSIKNQKAMEQLVEEVNLGDPCLLIGTQMLAKGHDFHNVTLVAIIDADASFFSADYRAIERSAQQLIQVAGRTGRGSKSGTVLIQTRQPEHPLFEPILRSDYSHIAALELEERQYCDLPPYSKMLSIRSEALNLEDSMAALEHLREQAITSLGDDEQIQVSGPIEANIARKSGIYRCFLHLFISDARKRSVVVNSLRYYLDKRKGGKAKLFVDADPLDYV